MFKTNGKDGTPVGSKHLCQACSWGQFVTGYRESDLVAICTNTSPNFVLPFKVCECSSFNDRHKPDWNQMEKLAIDIEPVRVSRRITGFKTASGPFPVGKLSTDDDEDEGLDPVARFQ